MRFPYLVTVTLLFCQLCQALAAPPPNDNFVNAIPLSGTNLTVTGTNVGATREIGEPNHEAPGGQSVWWTWAAPANGSVIIQTTGSTFDTLLAAYTSTDVNDLADSLVAGNDDSGSAQSSLIAFDVTSGTEYHIVVDGYNGASGDIQLQLSYRTNSIPSVPPNDNFASRTLLQGLEVSVAGENYFATKESGEPSHAEELGGASVWWSWTAPINGVVHVDTAGSDFDTLLAVYQGSVLTNLTVVTANDDSNTNSVTSSLSFNALAGMTYQIAVDGFDGQPGDIQLHLQTDIVLLGRPQVLDDGTPRFTLTGPFGQYAIERSTDLVNWERLSTVLNQSGSLDVSEPDSPGAQHFYRAVQLP